MGGESGTGPHQNRPNRWFFTDLIPEIVANQNRGYKFTIVQIETVAPNVTLTGSSVTVDPNAANWFAQ